MLPAADRRLDAWVERLRGELARRDDPEPRARRTVERLALALQSSLLVRHTPPEVADAFCASRLDDGGHAFGTLPPGALIDRHDPSA